MLELNPKGSHLSIIHGMTGVYMVDKSSSIANVFEQLRNFSDPCKCFAWFPLKYKKLRLF